MKQVPQATRDAAIRVRVIPVGGSVPEGVKTIGPVEAYSCKFLLTNPPASKGNALQQLQLNALEMGANAVVNVTFDGSGTDPYGTNCWDAINASGVAVLIPNNL